MELNHGAVCACGKVHSAKTEVITGPGSIKKLPELVKKLGGSRVFLLSDPNTYRAAGSMAEDLLKRSGIAVSGYCFSEEKPEPDEKSVGAALMHYDTACNLLVGVGSGVINDIGKLLSAAADKPYIIVATAPSMDGYASATSSMTRDGLKISLNSKAADVIIGDTDILRQAPIGMMKSGLGDMLAKYVSICEWRIAHRITGEYYCEAVAQLIRQAVKRCVEAAPGLMKREPEAVQAVFDGLVLGGIAMNYAGVSRPASGVEHYISHVLDMRGVEFHIPVESHGVQCAVGTLEALRLYDRVRNLRPNREKALRHAAQFDLPEWNRQLRQLLGRGAQSMIALEKTEGKYEPQAHARRLEIILENWEQLLAIMDEELPKTQALEALMETLELPLSLEALGVTEEERPLVLKATKDIRDKYVLTRLLWDLGELDEQIQ